MRGKRPLFAVLGVQVGFVLVLAALIVSGVLPVASDGNDSHLPTCRPTRKYPPAQSAPWAAINGKTWLRPEAANK